MDISSRQFAIVCYTILMDHYIESTPDYMEEKFLSMGNQGFNAFSFLDIHNQKKVIDYLKHWNFKVPIEVQEYFDTELRAYMRLVFDGIMPC